MMTDEQARLFAAIEHRKGPGLTNKELLRVQIELLEAGYCERWKDWLEPTEAGRLAFSQWQEHHLLPDGTKDS